MARRSGAAPAAGRRPPPADDHAQRQAAAAERAALLGTSSQPVAGVPGPGRWLVATYTPTALFALKLSAATSAVGKTLLIPTMYAIKMALVDAAFRAGYADAACGAVLRALVDVDVRIAPTARAVVTHTFCKIRQEPKTASREHPYISSVAYREVVHAPGWLVELLPYISWIGKRGSFVQFLGLARQPDLSVEFTQPRAENGFQMPSRWHVADLDDFGPQASLDVLSSYSASRVQRDRHRQFVQTIVPLGIVNVGPGFSEYERAE